MLILMSECHIPQAASNKKWLYVVALDYERGKGVPLVGGCTVYYWDQERVGISYLHVAIKHRGKGVGTAIVNRVIAEARKAGKRCVTLLVDKKNPRAEKLYRRLGFIQSNDDATSRWLIYSLEKPNVRSTNGTTKTRRTRRTAAPHNRRIAHSRGAAARGDTRRRSKK